MAGEKRSDKLIIAVVQKGDYDKVVAQLNKRNIHVTKISSKGGFLKKEKITMMIGIETERLEEVLNLLKTQAGKRKHKEYTTLVKSNIYRCPEAAMMFPVETETGGATIFVMDVSRYETF